MRHSIEPRDRIYVNQYEFLSFAKNIGKNLSKKYSQKILDSAKKSTTDAIKTASKWAIQKRAKETGDLIGNKIADKITNVSKTSSAEMRSGELHSKNDSANNESEAPQKRYVSPEKGQQIIDDLRLI